MRPTFRSDLTCSREEQQGVVFYRIDDPKSQTSFRLYEIEYLIAQKLDGRRSLHDVISAVKEDYNFDISEPDLQKFVNQLDSMGFVTKDGAGGGSAAAGVGAAFAPSGGEEYDKDTTNVMRRDVEPELEIVDPDVIEEPAAVDDAELRRLLKSALLHVKQGYIVHARDYFLAARELNPDDGRLAKLVSHLEIIGDASGPAEVEYLWNQAKELFPDVAEEVGPLADGQGGPGPKIADAAERASQSADGDLKTRLLWTVLVIVVGLGGIAGLYFFAREARIFEGNPKARVITVKAARVPVFHEATAKSVSAARETWLSFAGGGKVAEVSVEKGSRVDAEQIIAMLEVPAAIEKQLKEARAGVTKAEAAYDKAAKALEKLVQKREEVEAERNMADEKLKELKPKSVLASGGVSKRDMEKWKKVKVKANKTLTQLAKKERGPRQAEQKAKKALADAKKKLEQLEQKTAQKRIKAPFAGTIEEVKIEKGQNVAEKAQALLLRDSLAVQLSFVVKDTGGLLPGGEAAVALGRGAPSSAKVKTIEAAGDEKQVEVTLVDPTGAFVHSAPTEFKLVREFVEPAFEVPATAVFTDDHGTHVLVELQGRALVRDVELLSQDASKAVIRDRSGNLRDGEHVVTERVGDSGGVSTIADGSFLEVEP